VSYAPPALETPGGEVDVLLSYIVAEEFDGDLDGV
jgi:hypothetical protein